MKSRRRNNSGRALSIQMYEPVTFFIRFASWPGWVVPVCLTSTMWIVSLNLGIQEDRFDWLALIRMLPTWSEHFGWGKLMVLKSFVVIFLPHEVLSCCCCCCCLRCCCWCWWYVLCQSMNTHLDIVSSIVEYNAINRWHLRSCLSWRCFVGKLSDDIEDCWTRSDHVDVVYVLPGNGFSRAFSPSQRRTSFPQRRYQRRD